MADDDDLLISALNHSFAWYDARIHRGLQVINYLLVSMAIMATAYVNALNMRQYLIAAIVGLLAGMFIAIAYVVGYHQARHADRGLQALIEMQDRIAERLQLENFRLAYRWAPRHRENLVFVGILLASSLGSCVYALTRL